MALHITPAMQKRLDAGISVLYTARNGHVWYIDDATEDRMERFDIFDGTILQLGYPSLSIAQEAIETDSIYWKGSGWYRPVAFNWEDECLWCTSPEDVKELADAMKRRFTDRPSGVEYCGDGEEAIRRV